MIKNADNFRIQKAKKNFSAEKYIKINHKKLKNTTTAALCYRLMKENKIFFINCDEIKF